MLKLDPQSAEKIPASVDFFNSKPNLVAFQQSSTVEYTPNTALGTFPLHFTVNTGQCYVDMSKIELVTKFKLVKKAEGKNVPITATDQVSFIQGFGATFMKNVKVSFNGRAVYNSNDLYAYNAYMRRRLCLGDSRGGGELQSAGYFEDGLSQISGPGFDARRALFENDKIFEAVTTIDADIFRQKTLLLNQTVIDIEITPHNNFFALINTDTNEYKYDLVDCRLYVQQHMLIPQLDLSIQERLNKDVLAKYSYTRNIMKNFFISPGRYEYSSALFKDYLPKRVFVGLVDAKAFNGHIGMSPFEFAPHNVESIQISANGSLIPTYPYKLDWGSNVYGRAYRDMIKACKCSNDIDIFKFAKHSTIYGFDLQSEHDGDFVELQRIGATGINIDFSQTVPANGLQLIVYGEFNSILAMDKTRTITTAIPV